MLPVPFDPPIIRKVDPNLDPVMMTSTGPFSPYASEAHPKHASAYMSVCQTFSGKIMVGSPLTLGTRKLHLRVDKDGNTVLNRVLMSHFFVSEQEVLERLVLLRERKFTSLRPNKFGQTPLMLAVESGYSAAVREVLSLGPNLFAKDKEGHDAVDYLLYGTFRLDLDTLSPNYPVTLWRIGDMLVDYATQKQRAALQVRVNRHMGRVKALTTDKRWLNEVIP